MEVRVIKEMIGQTFNSVIGCQGGSESVVFENDRLKIEIFHAQDCCEQVRLYDVCGSPTWLVNSPIIMAEEVTCYENEPTGYSDLNDATTYDSHTWTFYKFATQKGWVTLRWLGNSNGYYSEKVNILITNNVISDR